MHIRATDERNVHMHMADALLSPAVGCIMWGTAAAAIAHSSHKIRTEQDDSKIPLMGVLGAFIFAAQMINFAIPATGSSGHLGGGLLLSILLGPHAAFIVMASVLTVQALFFADGGLLALGSNIINLGFFPAFIAYPVLYRTLLSNQPTQSSILRASIITAVASLLLGACGVVLQTVVSGVSSLPFLAFISLMLPIHLGIGIVEGLVTAAIVSFVYAARPEIILVSSQDTSGTIKYKMRTLAVLFLAAALLTGGIFSRYSSALPDGLEWSIAHLTGKKELETIRSGIHKAIAPVQEKIAFFPDYTFKTSSSKQNNVTSVDTADKAGFGTTVSGLLGSLLTLAVAGIVGLALRKRIQTT